MNYGKNFFCDDGVVYYGSRPVGSYHYRGERDCVARATIGPVTVIAFGENEAECSNLMRRSYESNNSDSN